MIVVKSFIHSLFLNYPQFLLPLGGHESLLGFLAGSLGLEPGPDIGLLPVDLCLLLIVAHVESPGVGICNEVSIMTL